MWYCKLWEPIASLRSTVLPKARPLIVKGSFVRRSLPLMVILAWPAVSKVSGTVKSTLDSSLKNCTARFGWPLIRVALISSLPENTSSLAWSSSFITKIGVNCWIAKTEAVVSAWVLKASW